MVYESKSLIREVHLRIVINLLCVNFKPKILEIFRKDIAICVSARCSSDQKKREERLRQRSDKRNKGGLGDLLNDKQSLRVDWTMQVCTYNTYLCHFVFVCYCSWFTMMSSFTNFAFDWACFLDLGWIVVQNDNYIIHVTVFHYIKYQLHYRMWCQTLQKC